MGTAQLLMVGLQDRRGNGASKSGTSRWRRQMVKNGMAQPLGLEPSAGCKREGPVADEWHQTQAESGPAPQGWDGPMAEQPRVAHRGMT